MSYNMYKSNKYTSLTQLGGQNNARIQDIVNFTSKDWRPLRCCGIALLQNPLRTSFERSKWLEVLYSPSGTLLVSYSIIWSSGKYIFSHFLDSLDIKFLQMAKNDPLRGPANPTLPGWEGNTRSPRIVIQLYYYPRAYIFGIAQQDS